MLIPTDEAKLKSRRIGRHNRHAANFSPSMAARFRLDEAQMCMLLVEDNERSGAGIVVRSHGHGVLDIGLRDRDGMGLLYGGRLLLASRQGGGLIAEVPMPVGESPFTGA